MSGSSRQSADSLQVLVVDDDPSTLTVLCRRLLAEGHDVSTFRGAKGLQEVIARRKPDLILIDVLMPDLNASGLSALLSRYPASRTPAVILHSKLPVRMLRRMMDVRDALGIIQKTTDDVEFSFAFNGILERSAESQSLYEQTPALSGTHRIDGEPFTYPAEEITSRTGPGRR